MDINLVLVETAKTGDTMKLRNLLKDDPFLLQRAMASSDAESPLHIACLGGHLDFVKEVTGSNPQSCTELSPDGYSPLHVASSLGYLEIVKELLKLGGSYVCLVKGKDKRIPLHCAAAKGRTVVVRELLSTAGCGDSIAEVTVRGETCLHLAVKNNQFEAFKALVELAILLHKEDILNGTDARGNTILHLVASGKQYEFVHLLLDKNFGYKGNLELSKLNRQGHTPLDVLTLHGGDSDIEEMLTLAGAVRTEQPQLSSHPQQVSIAQSSPSPSRQVQQPKSPWQMLQEYFMYDRIRESPSKVRTILLVISVLIATATYQAVLSPPGGVWQDDLLADEKGSNSTANPPAPHHKAGRSVMGTHNAVAYGIFLLFNSIGFFMSLHMMNFLTLGLPLQFELRVALLALTVTYDTCMVAISPSGVISMLFIAFSIMLPLVMVALSKLVRDYKRGRRCVSPNSMNTA